MTNCGPSASLSIHSPGTARPRCHTHPHTCMRPDCLPGGPAQSASNTTRHKPVIRLPPRDQCPSHWTAGRQGTRGFSRARCTSTVASRQRATRSAYGMYGWPSVAALRALSLDTHTHARTHTHTHRINKKRKMYLFSLFCTLQSCESGYQNINADIYCNFFLFFISVLSSTCCQYAYTLFCMIHRYYAIFKPLQS